MYMSNDTKFINTSDKTVNHLGTTVEKQKASNIQLPEDLSKQIKRLNNATQEVKQILKDHLPNEVLTNCWVVTLTPEHITMSVTSITAANHMRYMSSSYLNLLSSQSATFKNITSIKVIVSDC